MLAVLTSPDTNNSRCSALYKHEMQSAGSLSPRGAWHVHVTGTVCHALAWQTVNVLNVAAR